MGLLTLSYQLVQMGCPSRSCFVRLAISPCPGALWSLNPSKWKSPFLRSILRSKVWLAWALSTLLFIFIRPSPLKDFILDGQTLSFVPLDPPSFREVLQDSSAPRLDERNCPTKEEACHERAGRRNETGRDRWLRRLVELLRACLL